MHYRANASLVAELLYLGQGTCTTGVQPCSVMCLSQGMLTLFVAEILYMIMLRNKSEWTMHMHGTERGLHRDVQWAPRQCLHLDMLAGQHADLLNELLHYASF